MNALFLEEKHKKLGAKFIDFGGWNMPVQYSGIIAEHYAVRKNSGLFDISHMGKIFITGKDAEKFLNYVTTANFSVYESGQAVYTLFLNENAGIIDDLIVYKNTSEDFLLIVNAANINTDFNWLLKNKNLFQCEISNKSAEYCIFAVQGPKSWNVIQAFIAYTPALIKRFKFIKGLYNNSEFYSARTGYTGEDGVEFFVHNSIAGDFFDELSESLINAGGIFIGLGARDTLRLESAYMLHGNDIDEKTTPLEAGLNWVIKGSGFIGEAALLKQKQSGISKKLIGFQVVDKGIARHGSSIYCQKEIAGIVTSGTMPPMLNKAVGLAYIQTKFLDKELYADVRGKLLKIQIIPTPFIKKI